MKFPNFKIALTLLLMLVIMSGCSSAGAKSNGIWSGFLEGKTVDVSAEVGGRVTNIFIAEGDTIKAGQAMLSIDDDIAKLRIELADANIAAAQAQVSMLESGARSEDIAKAQARVDQARAALVAATRVVTDTEAIRATPQGLLIAIADAQARSQAAAQAAIAATKQAQGADEQASFWESQVKQMWEGTDIALPNGTRLHFDTPTARVQYGQEQWSQATNDAWQAHNAVLQATANQAAADAAYKDTADQLKNSVALDQRVNQARAARDRAAAALQSAEAALQVLREGASPAQIQVARAALDQARAARSELDKELMRYQVNASQSGSVARVFNRKGEIVGASVPLVRLTINEELLLRVFVPVSDAAQLQLGQIATLWVSELNNQSVPGKITYIADRTEYTSRISQTDNERNAQLVAVEVTIKSTDKNWKPGMPASVSFTQQAASPNLALSILQGNESLTFSGTVEAKATNLASEVTAKVVSVKAQKGDAVKAGDVLVQFDDAAIRASLAETDAAVRAAQSSVDQVKELARPGTVALVQSALAQAEAELKAARTALEDANRALSLKQDINTQLHGAESKWRVAQADALRAEATLKNVKTQVEIAERDQSVSGKTRLAILQRQQEAAEASLKAAQASYAGAKQVYEMYKAMLDNPLELLAAQHVAANQVKVTEAGLKVAQADLEIVKRPAQAEAVTLAEAKLRAAKASQGMVQAQVKRYAIVSPADGVVMGRSVEVGQTVRPGTTLLSIADTRELELTVFVPLRNMSALRVGQNVSVKSPSLPGKTYDSKVTYIAPESEFKPANIYNAQERSEIVFSVKIAVPNTNGDLKAGLPADATLGK